MSNQSCFGAPACQHVRLNGERCTQPARRNSVFCRFHASATQITRESRQLAEQLPVLEDAASVQLAIMKVVRYLMSRPLDDQNARAILSGLRLASANLARHRPLITVSPMVAPPAARADNSLSERAEPGSSAASSQEKLA